MQRKTSVHRESLLSIKQMAWLLLVLSILDACLTDIGLTIGMVYEANPLVRNLYAADAFHLWFYLIKVTVPLIIVFLSYRVRTQRMVSLFFWIAMMAYLFILFFHIVWITVYVWLHI